MTAWIRNFKVGAVIKSADEVVLPSEQEGALVLAIKGRLCPE